MALMPKRVKHRKSQRGRIRGDASRGNRVVFGDFGLQAVQGGWISAQTLEAGRIAAQQYLRTEGRLYIRVFPHKPITSIPLETRMGKGKGEPEYWAAVVKPGTVLYEIGGVSEEAARMCFTRLAHKMPVKVRFLRRRRVGSRLRQQWRERRTARIRAMTKASELREMSDEQLGLTAEGDDGAFFPPAAAGADRAAGRPQRTAQAAAVDRPDQDRPQPAGRGAGGRQERQATAAGPSDS